MKLGFFVGRADGRCRGPGLTRIVRSVEIRIYQEDDWSVIWPFFQEIIQAQETFPYDPEWTSGEAQAAWVSASGRTVVACVDGQVVGTATMGRNRPGPGSHVASASFMVAGAAHGKGLGRALVRDALAWAKESGFMSMQFNAVVETNVRAVRLYESVGFTVIGTVPEAFRHPALGLVGLHVMHRNL